MGVLLVGPVETVQRVILLAEPNVDQCHAKWRHVIRSRSLLQLVEDFPRFGALPSLAARIAERGARERRPTGKTDGAVQRADGVVISPCCRIRWTARRKSRSARGQSQSYSSDTQARDVCASARRSSIPTAESAAARARGNTCLGGR